MPAHRFRSLLRSSHSNPAVGGGGFVPCPLPLLNLFPATQCLYIQEVYRVARERTEAQIRRPAVRLPEASWN